VAKLKEEIKGITITNKVADNVIKNDQKLKQAHIKGMPTFNGCYPSPNKALSISLHMHN